MRSFIVVIAVGLLATNASALAQKLDSKSTPDTGANAAVDGGAGVNASKVLPDTARSGDPTDHTRGSIRDQQLRERTAGASNPFPYADAAEPPREPYRRPVPCSPFARETDGSTTCIGVDEGPRERRQTVARPSSVRLPARAAVPPHLRAWSREIVETRLTDPRFDPSPVGPPVPSIGGNGLLSFLEGVFSR